jgi:hypothetical protein
MPRPAFDPMLLGPASGVFTADAAFEAWGTRTLRAERELDSPAAEGDASTNADTVQRREAGYRQYLDQNGLVPLKEALEKLSAPERSQ